jgi:hypothetical protein
MWRHQSSWWVIGIGALARPRWPRWPRVAVAVLLSSLATLIVLATAAFGTLAIVDLAGERDSYLGAFIGWSFVAVVA